MWALQVVNNRAGDRTAARNVAQYLDGARAKLVNASWEVLEVRQSPDLPDGTLKAFVLIDGNSVQTVKIHVPRQVSVRWTCMAALTGQGGFGAREGRG